MVMVCTAARAKIVAKSVRLELGNMGEFGGNPYEIVQHAYISMPPGMARAIALGLIEAAGKIEETAPEVLVSMEVGRDYWEHAPNPPKR